MNKKSGKLAHVGKWTFNFVIIGLLQDLVLWFFIISASSVCIILWIWLLDTGHLRRLGNMICSHLLTDHLTNGFSFFFLPFGGIISGWLVYTFAPEAEGHGTDAAIDAYHNKGGLSEAGFL